MNKYQETIISAINDASGAMTRPELVHAFEGVYTKYDLKKKLHRMEANGLLDCRTRIYNGIPIQEYYTDEFYKQCGPEMRQGLLLQFGFDLYAEEMALQEQGIRTHKGKYANELTEKSLMILRKFDIDEEHEDACYLEDGWQYGPDAVIKGKTFCATCGIIMDATGSGEHEFCESCLNLTKDV